MLLGDGTELEADVVVLGTGYRPLNDTVSRQPPGPATRRWSGGEEWEDLDG